MARLAENAYRELRKDEIYIPVLSPDKTYREVNLYSVGLGFVFAIIFTFALMYLALKLGLGISADTPVAIIAVGLAMYLKRPDAYGENYMMSYIPFTASAVMATGTFLFPAFIILKFDVSYWDLLLTLILGGVLGTLVSIIFRKYFVQDMHGKYPFPGSVATSEILVSGQSSSAKVMVVAGIIGFIYDLVTGAIGWWNEVFSTRAFEWGKALADKYKMVFSIDVSAAFLGIGYLTGLRYSAIIAAGSVFGGFVCIPLISVLFSGSSVGFVPQTPEYIYSHYVKFIGVGALATGGIIGLIKMLNVIGKAMVQAVRDIISHKAIHEATTKRTDLDLSMRTVFIAIIINIVLIAIFIYFRAAHQSFMLTGISTGLVIIFSCLFSIVAAISIGYTNIEPVSGMTILMLIVSAVIFSSVGVSGATAAIMILIVAAVVCSMLGQAGYIAGAYKVGYLIGCTPKKLEVWGIVAVIVTSPIIIFAFMILNKAYGFTGSNALPAPQGNAMASVLQPLIAGEATPWIFYIIGASVSVTITLCGISALPFAMGMYLPMSLATPFIVGGFLSWIVETSSKDEKIKTFRKQKGIVIASGLIAGGAIAGIFTAVLQILSVSFVNEKYLKTGTSQILGLVVLVCLCIFTVFYAIKNKKNKGYLNDKSNPSGYIL
ncbi:MAG TPA: oligopeptide transporter, OPT family [Lentisphaeria bacterium]|nr:MAG: oligopeptide transporter, OPT family [Lentisphaerae bacterium GWF2_38_69]HBM17170.1 oligopeptide transporter, OPT family [Lentisphaeria bacterium]